jgi:O-succinylbenzoic acid--CoA ligase
VTECPVARAARLRPGAAAIEIRGETVSYAQLEDRVQDWQRRIAGAAPRLFAPGVSSVETVALVHAAARAGVAVALLNPRLTATETAALVASLQPATAADALPPQTALAPQPSGSVTAAIDLDAVQLLLFTSGTTGAPKAAQLTAGQLQASALASNQVIGLDASSRFLCCLPLFHIGGLSIALRCAAAGATLVLHERFDALATARALEDGVTHVSLVASTLARTLLQLRRPLAHVRAALIGGGPVPQALLERARTAGLPVLQTYGLTETCAQVTCERPGEADGATAGPSMPGMELRIQQGEIEVRGPALMLGYLGQPPLPRDWFRTGDLGALDDRGRLTVFARRVDLILSGGENVYPAEIEAALQEHPDVVEAAVVPVADPRWGQAGCAFVALRNDCDLQAFLRGRLAGFKIPRQFVRVEALPRTAAGKVDRRALIRSLEPQFGTSPAAGAAAARGR